ncbi:TPA: hypothetical protein OR077_004508 [Escherichia coli]|uniref:hypothetical protein n=1 Tax=Enterobacteriaceae TaxID=543 RepID=UPI000698C312|nr:MULTISPECIES: hypothetical protein [Enterobacteriaceae]RDA97670.1 hypothetical protein DVB85_24575 [Klebsiella oxytoca]ELK0617476.1 hypothetical protein [Escherichia coli]MBZ7125920.1 hypothetical protein [Klebsiella grimontii]MCH8591448.1 hypothetical protein [Escherichia coli]MDA6170851.1 hypothetical protein [Escherichia coli]
MRAFSNGQQDTFLNAFGQLIQTSTGSTFTGIVEVLPVSIEAAGGFIESTETYVTMRKDDLVNTDIDIGTVLIIDGVNQTIYNIEDDLSGMVNCYFRTSAGASFAEDY